MKRLGRFRFLVYALVALLLVLGGGRLLLSSSFAATKVASQLSELIGAPVQVSSVNIGLSGSTVRGLQILETAGPGRSYSWLTAQEVQADVSAMNVVSGNSNPHEVTLADASIALRFDAEGHLVTRLPEASGSEKALPKLRVEGGKVTLFQEGHAQPLVVKNVTGETDGTSGLFAFVGTTNDPYWGEWTVKVDIEKNSLILHLHTDRADVTLEKLKRLPFVSAGVWEEVRIEEGITPVDLKVSVPFGEPTVHYRIVLAPRATRLRITAIDLDADQAEGQVVIADKLVELRNVKGRTAGGTVSTAANLDFRAEPSHLDFTTIRLDDVELQSLPESWELKQYQMRGKLTGQASLDVLIKPGGKGVETHGSGEGVITQAFFRNLPISEPVKLHLHPEGKRFRLKPEKAPLSLLPIPREERDPVGVENVAYFEAAPASAEWGETLAKGAKAAAHGAVAFPQQMVSSMTSAATTLGQLLNRSGPKPGEAPNYLEAQLTLKDVDLRQTIEQLGLQVPFPVTGRLSIQMKLGVPVDTPKDFKTYRMSGTADLPTLSIAGLDLTNVHAGVRLDNGVLRLNELKADVAGAPLTGQAELRVEGDYPFEGKADLARFNLETLRRLSPDVRPPVAVQGNLSLAAKVRGELRTQKFAVSGTANSTDLVVEKVRIDALAFEWEAEKDRIRIHDLKSKLYEGAIAGDAVLPLRDEVAGRVNLRVSDMDVLTLTKALPAVPLRLEGRVSGTLATTLAAADPNKPRETSTRIELTAPRLRVQNIPTQKLRADVNYRAGKADYHLEGESLGGTFKLEGSVPPAPEKDGPEGKLTIENVRLSRLGAALGQPDRLGPLAGRLSATLTYRHGGPGGTPLGTGRLRIADLRWGDRAIVEDLSAELRLTDQQLQVSNVNGLLGEGILGARLVINLRDQERSYFTLNLDHADAGRVLAPFPDLAKVVDGSVEVNLRGKLGREWSAAGSIGLTRGHFLGVGVSDWRLPVTMVFAPAEGRGRLEIRESVAQVAHGRATVGVTYSWGTDSRLNGNVRFYNAEFESLAARSNSLRSVAVGKVTGRFDFASTNFHTLDDLTGVLEARLAQSQALELPVLNVLVPFIAPGRSATSFQQGHINARLSRGYFHIQRLALTSPALRLMIIGNAGLNGRLDLDVTAQTGDAGINTTALRLLASRVPAIGPVPVALIAQASTLLANRVVHLRVTGTTDSPIVRVDPIALLTEEAVRLFLTNYLVPLPSTTPLP